MKIMTNFIIGTGIIGLLLSASLVIADDDDRHEKKKRGDSIASQFFYKKLDVAPVKNELYREECGSCHFAYQPGLLPSRSWKKMMSDLENHFDENAELDAESQASLTQYLVANSADTSNYKRSRKIMNSLRSNSTPLRITKIPYFIRKHDEIPRRMVQDNPKLGSFSKCAACHVNAEKGSYEDDDVRIPGVGKWHD